MFGAITDDFKDIGSSLLQALIRMVTGQIVKHESDESLNVITQAIYFILLVLVCLLILQQLFTSIIDGQFMDLATSIKIMVKSTLSTIHKFRRMRRQDSLI